MQMDMVQMGVLVSIGIMVLIETTALLLLKRNIKKFMKRAEKYIAYILEDTQDVEAPIYEEESKNHFRMNEREKERLLQEVLADYFS